MECMLCYEEAGSAGFMDPHPCNCRGTMQIHEACFQRLREQYSKCPACMAEFPQPPLVYENGLAKVKKVDNVFRVEYTVNEAGQKHGTETTYMYDAKIEELEWVNGDQHGIKRTWYESGQLESEETWEHDLPHGYHYEWYENGRIQHKAHWVHGDKQNLEYYWYENGRIEAVISWHRGEQNGDMKQYSETGQLEYQSFWYCGMRHGLEHFYHPNGRIERRIPYNMGKKNGLEQHFDEQGVLVQEIEWSDDRVTGREPLSAFRAWMQIGI